MIEVEALSRWSRKKKVLDGVAFTLPAGEVLGIVGPNGSGKTALIRVLATLDAASEGEARIAGFSVVSKPRKVRELIGYVPEQCGFYRMLTAEEHISFYAGVYGVSRSSRWKGAGALLDLVGLDGHGDEIVEHLSQGQKQRLSLARALVHDPEVLLLDYDGSDLDPRGQIEFRALVGQLDSIGKTIVLSSHNLDAVEAMCGWVAFMVRGAMPAVGPIGEVTAGSTGLSEVFQRLTEGEAHAAGSAP